jgi:pyruvate formate lyase activating enzyme
VRENQGGRLYNLVYGKPGGLQIDPIELEPMYHMIPGHRNLCVFTASCNFRCKHCHNWHISQQGPEGVRVVEYSPEEVVEEAIRRGCKSISHSINEPTVFYEFMYDVARVAKERGLLTLFHSNGSLSPQPLRRLLKVMDGVTVDLKAFDEKFYQEISSAELEPVLRTLKIIVEEGVHLEIVNLIIPTLNDDLDKIKEMCIWIRDNLGEDVPLHFTRFSPAYKLTKLPYTPVETLEAAREIAHKVGLNYVYIGNLPGHEGNSTFCPKCKKRLVHRIHFAVLSNNVVDGRCGSCGYEIAGIWNQLKDLQ